MSRPALVSAVLNVFQRKKRQNAHNYPEAHERQDALWAAKERTDSQILAQVLMMMMDRELLYVKLRTYRYHFHIQVDHDLR